jgi:glycosyltransferase involved in cell wall biosynthesis
MQTGPYDRAISLIICTRNRASLLTGCLEALARTQFDPHAWELIVVNNGSTDQTDDLLRSFACAMPFRATVVHERRPGLSYARNTSRSPLVAVTDDDCYVAGDFVTRVVEAFRNPRYGYVGGRVLLHDPSDAPETIKDAEEPEEVAPHSIVRPGFLHGANLSFRREVWDAVGGFDPLFGSGTRFVADDVDFVGRASAAGWAGAYLPGPVVRHHHGRKPGADVAKLRTVYARGRGAYYTKGCLNHETRWEFARHWYWHLRRLVFRRRFPELVHEIAAGAEYLVKDLFRLRQRPATE